MTMKHLERNYILSNEKQYDIFNLCFFEHRNNH